MYQFTPKHRWQIKLHMMSGITFGPWLKFLWRFGRNIDWLRYGHRVRSSEILSPASGEHAWSHAIRALLRLSRVMTGWAAVLPQVMFLSAMSIINSALALPDWMIYGRRISRQELHPEPVFILGHPRTGTTHLHNLLSLDPAFAFCTTFHAGDACMRHLIFWWTCLWCHHPPFDRLPFICVISPPFRQASPHPSSASIP